MTYNVFGGTLSLTQSINQVIKQFNAFLSKLYSSTSHTTLQNHQTRDRGASCQCLADSSSPFPITNMSRTINPILILHSNVEASSCM